MKKKLKKLYQNLRDWVRAEEQDFAGLVSLVAEFESLGGAASYRPDGKMLQTLFAEQRAGSALDLEESEALAKAAFADLGGMTEANGLVELLIGDAGTGEDAFAKILSERPIAGEIVEVKLLVRNLEELAELLGTDVESLRAGTNLYE